MPKIDQRHVRPGLECARVHSRSDGPRVPADHHPNLWRDMERRNRRLVPLETAGEPAIASRGDQLAELGWTERQLELVAAGDRDALLLHAREGLSYDEVARRLDISVGAVKSRVFRARQALRNKRGEGDKP